MKNRYFTIGLIVAVIFIWSMILYKIFISSNSIGKGQGIYPDHINNKTPDSSGINYTIHSYIKDPFLSILEDTTTIIETVEPVTVKIRAEKVPVVLPAFFGLIQNGKKKTAIFQIGHKVFFVHEGEYIQTLKLKNISADSAILQNDGGVVVIRLSKKKMQK